MVSLSSPQNLNTLRSILNMHSVYIYYHLCTLTLHWISSTSCIPLPFSWFLLECFLSDFMKENSKPKWTQECDNPL
jgi:hypothetical protein